ncbi:sugar transferase [Aliiroseovarius crassostreae]|uniref:sugar transferase n=1 Tax=Aliiroseovarius crassostreae TaxID=154981 RepID=UPI001C2C0198|nr:MULTISPECIES: sugar transferase [Aliiroseovarius]
MGLTIKQPINRASCLSSKSPFQLQGHLVKDFGYKNSHDNQRDVASQAGVLKPYRAIGKRGFDILLALFLLPVLAPIIALFILLIRRDGGPGLYSQERIGLKGQRFRCWKLRTMVQDAEQRLEELCALDTGIAREWREKQKLENDPRITPIGHFLRATSLDELPQIFNVLLGDMSFVGPRPFMASQEPLYREAGGTAYFSLRPGITGPWQVAARGQSDFLDRIHFDQNYLEQHSLGYDLKLMLQTVGVVVQRTGH